MNIVRQEPCPVVGAFAEIGNVSREYGFDEEMRSLSISKEHNYCKLPKSNTPIIAVKKLAVRMEISKLRRTIYKLRLKVKHEKKIAEKKFSKFKNFDKLPNFMQEFFENILKYFKTKSHPKKYSPEMRQFALTLHYYSPTAYCFVRDVFINCLPSTSTIKSWYCSINGEPGCSNDALLAIQNLQFETPYSIVGCVLTEHKKATSE